MDYENEKEVFSLSETQKALDSIKNAVQNNYNFDVVKGSIAWYLYSKTHYWQDARVFLALIDAYNMSISEGIHEIFD